MERGCRNGSGAAPLRPRLRALSPPPEDLPHLVLPQARRARSSQETCGAGGKDYVRQRLPRSMAMSKPPASSISSLRPSTSATIEATVTMLEAIREIDTRDGTKKKVRNGKVKDATGEIALVLWGSEVEMVVQGDKVRIVDGWVKDYQGKPQISLGRSGKLEKL